MALEDQTRWIILVGCRCTWDIQISPLTKKNNKADVCELSVLIYLSMLRTKWNLVRGDFG